MTWTIRLTVAAGVTLLASVVAWAQGDPRPVFDVVSVKPNTTGPVRMSSGFQPGGRYSAVNTPLRHVIHEAYRVQDFQLEAGPRWIVTDGFDIEAKAAANAPRAQLELMLQALLAERFKLVVRHETRDLPVLALVATADTERRLRPSVATCGQAREEFPNHMTRSGDARCGERVGNGYVRAVATMPQLAGMLTPWLRRIVSDQTGVPGSFALELAWEPDGDKKGKGDRAVDRPSLSTALRERLGLRLEAQRRPVDILVIERAEPPTEN